MCDKQHSFNKLSFVEFIVACDPADLESGDDCWKTGKRNQEHFLSFQGLKYLAWQCATFCSKRNKWLTFSIEIFLKWRRTREKWKQIPLHNVIKFVQKHGQVIYFHSTGVKFSKILCIMFNNMHWFLGFSVFWNSGSHKNFRCGRDSNPRGANPNRS